jgi:tRNA-dihydrouridine synthase A
MDWTDVYYRQLARMISRHTWLYTEMVVDQTLLHSPFTDKFLWFPPEQHPIVCQLGGSDPELLARAAQIVERYGYDEININCGGWVGAGGAGRCGGGVVLPPPRIDGNAAAASRRPPLLGRLAGTEQFPALPAPPARPAGCPSDRVAGAGCFGAAMMLRPELVAACCKAMQEAVSSPITVKCRLGE